ncbi:MAG: type II toxin-antitoxin system VapC family toxin [Syntrophales bacterium]|nr:type II toxin-antitoxin system VapC family toxin [Syntrophales bacterium]
MVWVIDASVALRWFIEDEKHPNADEVLRCVVSAPELFAVPELFSFEVFSVLSRIHPSGRDAFIRGVIPILNGGILRYPMTEKLATRASGFVKKGLTGYDACYAALARETKGLWLTFDARAHACLTGERVSHLLTEALPKGWPQV